jgi:pseudouridine kinase
MTRAPDILCIGSVLWDVIGRAALPMSLGNDVPGRIARQPGGVALNVAVALARLGRRPALLSAVGQDAEGDELLAECAERGLVTEFVHRDPERPTDRYMAVEDPSGLIAAVADAHSLEAAGDAILAPLADGRLGSAEAPYAGPVALDGNLTHALLTEIAESPAFAAADLRVAPASPGKADRLKPFLCHPRATLYVNLEEAALLAGRRFAGTPEAAVALMMSGAARVCVTDGAGPATIAEPGGIVSAAPPKVRLARVTGAGDCFMAAHIAAETTGLCAHEALERALVSAAAHVAGDTIP